MLDASDVEAFARRLERAPVGIDRSTERVNDEWGERLAGTMREAAPKDTMELALSIRHVGDGVVEVGAKHGPHQEYGTARHGPQSFARPGLRAVREGYVGDAGRAALAELT